MQSLTVRQEIILQEQMLVAMVSKRQELQGHSLKILHN